MTENSAAFDIIDRDLSDVMGEKYISYALSTIMSRSLPDVRDGLKPVHRRILYAMYQLRLNPDTSPKKCARVVGDVIGKFHPHGDQAVYDSLARLAQDFSVRYPLVDGQGNFGNIDGDNPAAMRYTEARMTDVALSLLSGISEDAVDLRETYDGDTVEPVVLPANFPNILANGAYGIAVGMATSIPPHNVGEICDALDLLIDKKTTPIEDLLEHIQGPDLPTGGTLVEDKSVIMEAYKTGRGSFRVRSKWHKEDLKQGMYQIVVTEIPYQVQKSKLIEKIAELIISKKIAFLDDVIDESAEDVRVVLVPKNRNVEPEVLMEALFRYSDLEGRFSLNMNVLDGGVTPRVMNVKEVLLAFIDHRQEVLIRKSEYRLRKIAERLDVLVGYLTAYLNIDEVIQIIREEDDPKKVLMERFQINEAQSDAILNMKLRNLRKLEEIEIRREHDELLEERTSLDKLIASDTRQMTVIRKETKEIKEKFGQETELGKRRTVIASAPKLIEVPTEAMVEKEPITVVCSEKGWVRSMKGHLDEAKLLDLKYKDSDREKFVFHAETTDKILAFSTDGRFFTIGADKLPAGRGFGEPIRLMFEIPNDADIISLMKHDPERKLLIAADDCRGFVVNEKDVIAQTKNGKQVLNVKGDVEALICTEVIGDHVAVIGENRKLLVFPVAEIPEMGRGRGVILQKYKDGGLSDVKSFNLEEGLSWKMGERNRNQTDLLAWLGKRAAAGKLPPNGFPRNNKF